MTEGNFTLRPEGDLWTVVAIELCLRPEKRFSTYMDDWRTLDWTGLEESIRAFPALRAVTILFQRARYREDWSTTEQQQLEAAAEELNLGEKLVNLCRAGNLVVQVAQPNGEQPWDEKRDVRRTLKLAPAPRTSLSSTVPTLVNG